MDSQWAPKQHKTHLLSLQKDFKNIFVAQKKVSKWWKLFLFLGDYPLVSS